MRQRGGLKRANFMLVIFVFLRYDTFNIIRDIFRNLAGGKEEKKIEGQKFLSGLLLCITILAMAAPLWAQPWDGSGEPNDPYLIYDANDMQ